MTEQHRHEPILNVPPVTQTLCLLNVAIFLFIAFLPDLMNDEAITALAFIPARYTDPQLFGIDALTSPVTHMFIHAGWLHISFNVATLLAFGAGVEKNMGSPRMLLLYFVTGLCGAALHFALQPHSTIPMLGASGAISGLCGAVIIMMYGESGKLNLRTLLPITALWIGVTVLFGFFGMPGEADPIAWDTHLGSFISGMLLYRPLLRFKA